MDLKQLRTFVAVCEDGSVSRAALRLRIAQPALSQQIRNLESELKVPLLVREPRGVRPTEAGERFLTYARRITEEMAYAVEVARGAMAEPEGSVRLGLPGPICEVLGIPLIEALAERCPAVRLQVVEAMSGYLLEWLRDARVDLALLYVTPETRDLPGERIFREALHLIVPAGRTPPLTPQGSVTFATAAELDLVLPGAPHGLRVLLDGAAKRAGLQLRPVMETDSYFLMRQLVVRGRACAILPPQSAAAELANGRLASFPVALPSLAREIAIAYATPRPPRLAVTAVGTLCRDVLAALAEGGAWPGESIAEQRL